MIPIFRTISIPFLICAFPFAASALTFSCDSMKAFDGKLWQGNYGDDSVVITNNADTSVAIDSIFIKIDTSAYDNFDIGWIEKNNGQNSKKREFNVGSIENISCNSASVKLTDYNSNKTGRISIAAHNKITIFSPYFSTKCSPAGVIVECIGWADCEGCCYPLNAQQHNSYFSGKIVFISNKNYDTLRLLCVHTTWTTGITSIKIANTAKNPTPSNTFCNAIGQKLCQYRKLLAYYSVRFKRGNSIIVQK